MHALNISVAENSRKSVKIYALKEQIVSTAIWLQHSVENHNEERQVGGKKSRPEFCWFGDNEKDKCF